jgi:hypothetical protein
MGFSVSRTVAVVQHLHPYGVLENQKPRESAFACLSTVELSLKSSFEP